MEIMFEVRREMYLNFLVSNPCHSIPVLSYTSRPSHIHRLVARPIIGTTVLVAGTGATDLAPAVARVVPLVSAEVAARAVAVVLAPEGGEALLLGVCVDVCADDEADDVEEGDPGGFGEELLGES